MKPWDAKDKALLLGAMLGEIGIDALTIRKLATALDVKPMTIYHHVPSKEAIEMLIAPLDMANTVPMDARAYKFDIVLRGRRSTMFENRPEGN